MKPNPLLADRLPLSVEALSYRYRGQEEWALRDICFEAAAGEVLLIAGASGSGKTTLIRCLNGLVPRSYKGGVLHGMVHLWGRPTRVVPEEGQERQAAQPAPQTLAEIARQLGTVLQDPERQIVGSRVVNDVAFGLENLGIPRADMRRRVAAALEHLGIADLAERETASLSGGEKQKVAVAGALVMDPPILLLDEPLANLDPASALEALELFRRLADEGRTILIVEHRVEEVLHIHPEKALYLSAGRQHYFGPLAGLLDTADPREIKLPVRHAVARLRDRFGVQVFGCSGVRAGTDVDATAPAPEHLNTRTPEHRPLVEFEGVSFAFDPTVPVLQDVTLAVREGDVIAVLGPNGAGKSTLVRHAIGLVKPVSGVVRVAGRDTRELTTAELARTVGYVFQSPAHMLFAPTVEEEIAFGPRNLGFAEERIASITPEVLAGIDLPGTEKHSPLALSFGQQKRLSIAAILAMEPRVLVMDEPTAGQDYGHYTGLMRTILGIADCGLRIADWGTATNDERPTTNDAEHEPGERSASVANPQSAIRNPQLSAVLFITHDLDLAISFANRVWLLADGRVVADGPPHEVLADSARLEACRLYPTSLLELNQELLPRTGRFLPLEAIAMLEGSVSEN